ncbi:MAG: hypothetical protein COB34_02350 [Methylophilaceae bacterium]|nr:MAG: hypothetical protein COB34_02350 [Methylophilaceae bacterium]
MKNKTMPAIDISLQPSRLLLGVLLLISILTCLSVIIVAIPFGIKLCLLIGIIVSSVYFILRDVLQALPWSWQRVEVSSTGELRLSNQQGQLFEPTLHATSFIHPRLVILNTKKPNTGKWFKFFLPPVLIFPSTTEQHRQLRVWLRWWEHEGS